MNRTCNGDVFARWGETWARCFLDSALFQITAPIETCPNCGRPWEGREIQRDGRRLLWDPDTDPRVMVMDRDRRIAALESQLAAARARADAADDALRSICRLAVGEEEVADADLCRTAIAAAECSEERRGNAELALEAAETRADAEAANGAALRTAAQAMLNRFLPSVLHIGCGAKCNVCGVEEMAHWDDLTHAADCPFPALRDLLALPASEAVARVQALVEAARQWKRVRGTIAEIELEQAVDAFAGHANKGDAR